MITKQVNTFIE